MSRTATRPRRPSHTGVESSASRFRDRAIARRRRPWLRALGTVAVAGVLVGAGYVVGWTDVLGVREVVVSGVDGAEEKAVRGLVDVPPGTPLARVDTAAVEADVRTRITVAEVSVRRGWPRSLEVDVVPRTAAIVVKNPQGRLEVVDATGVAFGTVKKAPKGIPVVTATGERAMTPEALAAAFALLTALPEDLADDVSAVTVSSADLVTFTLGKRTVVWGGADDAELKIRVLRALLGTKARTIDVSAPNTPVTR
ncbi:FtsQ-type POTRA domain-containing protein [Phycicoccus sp. CSK15P-2]|uniref:cell division protein FtsQ/DivIB n=1 Tax=Phycicoccus sp. CSK15P-2 TaxID=2807627 RepID=UPI00194DBE36|nr:FtsQ-type POTRA domain-containing protein [Phycicoccus sp. CSK15P-2]MBM6404115.1 FtsQ-type POTRA domain-containing protein [Phycicoccus sp. CSK15P-2]